MVKVDACFYLLPTHTRLPFICQHFVVSIEDPIAFLARCTLLIDQDFMTNPKTILYNKKTGKTVSICTQYHIQY